MKVEYHGVIETQPVFQHVGYVSSACKQTVTDTRVAGLGMSLFVLGSVLALATARRASGMRRARQVILGLLAALMLLGGPALFAHRDRTYVQYYHFPEMLTEWRMREAYARVGKEVSSLSSGPPNRVAWAWTPEDPRGSIEDDMCDAWGTRFRYRRLDKPDWRGRRYEVVSAGPDRQFDTPDDVRDRKPDPAPPSTYALGGIGPDGKPHTVKIDSPAPPAQAPGATPGSSGHE